MPSRFVVQPNGKFAVFSTIVDSFTAANLTEEEILAGGSYYLRWGGRYEAERALQKAKDELDDKGNAQQPLFRWNESLQTIKAVRGEEHLAETLKEIEEDANSA